MNKNQFSARIYLIPTQTRRIADAAAFSRLQQLHWLGGASEFMFETWCMQNDPDLKKSAA